MRILTRVEMSRIKIIDNYIIRYMSAFSQPLVYIVSSMFACIRCYIDYRTRKFAVFPHLEEFLFCRIDTIDIHVQDDIIFECICDIFYILTRFPTRLTLQFQQAWQIFNRTNGIALFLHTIK